MRNMRGLLGRKKDLGAVRVGNLLKIFDEVFGFGWNSILCIWICAYGVMKGVWGMAFGVGDTEDVDKRDTQDILSFSGRPIDAQSSLHLHTGENLASRQQTILLAWMMC